MGAFLGVGELEGGAAADDLDLVLDPLRDELVEPQGAGYAVDERQHVAAEGVLQRGVLVQVVHHDPRLGVAFQHDHQAQTGSGGGVVADVGDAGEAPRVHQFRDLGGQVVGVAHVGQLRDRDALTPGGVLLQFHDGPHDHRSASRAVSVLDAAPPDDQPATGEVGALDAGHRGLEEFLPGGVGMGQRPLDGVVDLAQVVGGDVGGHAHRDARGAVHEEVREPRRQHRRFGVPVVVVGFEVDGVLFDVTDHLDGQRSHLALGVAHRGGLVVALGTEVALPGDEGMPHRPWLRQAHQGVVDGAVAVGVVETHHIADHAGTLVPAAVGPVSAVPHRVQDATVHGFEAVAHVREGAPHDHGHGVVEVGLLDLHLEVDGGGVPLHLLFEALRLGLELFVDALGAVGLVSHG